MSNWQKSQPIKRLYNEGELIPYRGKPLAIRIVPPQGNPFRLVSPSEDGLSLLVRARPGEDIKKHIIFFFTAGTEEIIRSSLPQWAKKLGARPASASVKLAKSRWGSCSSSGKLFFNSRMSMLSDDVSEYIIVHELCHLKQMNHSKAFWDLVRSALPDCMALRRKLRAEEKDAMI
jgi:predicted metal-dependent hydrolase